ncbi:MAG: hypothetical protein E6R05_01550 [Candidatus Moraniibacteriota bacterium]|nr:MAG: hypothetical protein E6R05_01550 [Candidatus Moranbacteria bacterium]
MRSKLKFLLFVFSFLSLLSFFPFSSEAASFSVDLSASPRTIAPGESTTIRWTVAWGNTPQFSYICTSPQLGDITVSDGSAGSKSGSVVVSPTTTQGYSLTCTSNNGAGETVSATVVVTVSAAPTVAITALPSSLPDGGGSTVIRWFVGAATSCTPLDGTPEWRAMTGMNVDGSRGLIVTETTTFSLSCTNTSGAVARDSTRVTVGGGSDLCGNGVIDTSVGEECDNGSSGNGTCPLTCSATCQDQYGCDSVATVSISASPSRYDPGESVRIRWESSKAVSCEAKGGEGFNNPIATSGSIMVRPTRDFQNYQIECYDAGGKSVTDAVAVRIDTDYELAITSFSATPATVPFGYTGNIDFSWRATASPDGTVPTCQLGALDDSASLGDARWIGKGVPVVDLRGSDTLPIDRLNSVTGTSGSMTLLCKIDDGTAAWLKEYRDVVIYFQSDPSKAPEVSLTVGRGSDRTLDGPVPAGTSVKVYRGVNGAERCEWTDSSGTSTIPPFVGEQVFDITLNQTTIFMLKCWNGALESRAEFVAMVTGSSPPGSLPPAGGAPPGTGSTPPVVSFFPILFQNPLKFNNIPDLLTTLLSSLLGLIVTLALIMIVVGAFLYITSAGDEGRMETGKKTILAALIGLALGIAAPAFLREIGSILGWTSALPTGVGTSLTLIEIASRVLSFLLTIIGILAIIMLVIGGIMYLTAAGNEDQIDRGKKIVKYSLIGITIALAALVLVRQLAAFFG